ncbi:hypothetical protein HELRODRAFT_190158 [Helobdella robusta]|uniref:Uncharacterized protein n=1 Tax=Helobdella robusta TaxID=6412 RepID=T1FRR1_HELRO|nr:hypothetical protein HELRODRAFT_190158 [Helobdella robusta]ESO10751.1 hypothetical protein HELRODRAFT_190158 [Helobdella robusta]
MDANAVDPSSSTSRPPRLPARFDLSTKKLIYFGSAASKADTVNGATTDQAQASTSRFIPPPGRVPIVKSEDIPIAISTVKKTLKAPMRVPISTTNNNDIKSSMTCVVKKYAPRTMGYASNDIKETPRMPNSIGRKHRTIRSVSKTCQAKFSFKDCSSPTEYPDVADLKKVLNFNEDDDSNACNNSSSNNNSNNNKNNNKNRSHNNMNKINYNNKVISSIETGKKQVSNTKHGGPAKWSLSAHLGDKNNKNINSNCNKNINRNNNGDAKKTKIHLRCSSPTYITNNGKGKRKNMESPPNSCMDNLIESTERLSIGDDNSMTKLRIGESHFKKDMKKVNNVRIKTSDSDMSDDNNGSFKNYRNVSYPKSNAKHLADETTREFEKLISCFDKHIKIASSIRHLANGVHKELGRVLKTDIYNARKKYNRKNDNSGSNNDDGNNNRNNNNFEDPDYIPSRVVIFNSLLQHVEHLLKDFFNLKRSLAGLEFSVQNSLLIIIRNILSGDGNEDSDHDDDPDDIVSEILDHAGYCDDENANFNHSKQGSSYRSFNRANKDGRRKTLASNLDNIFTGEDDDDGGDDYDEDSDDDTLAFFIKCIVKAQKRRKIKKPKVRCFQDKTRGAHFDRGDYNSNDDVKKINNNDGDDVVSYRRLNGGIRINIDVKRTLDIFNGDEDNILGNIFNGDGDDGDGGDDHGDKENKPDVATKDKKVVVNNACDDDGDDSFNCSKDTDDSNMMCVSEVTIKRSDNDVCDTPKKFPSPQTSDSSLDRSVRKHLKNLLPPNVGGTPGHVASGSTPITMVESKLYDRADDPVAKGFYYGDEKHFVPIEDEDAA